MFKQNNKNPFRNPNGGRVEKSKKAAEWGKVKFNPVAKTVVTETATPWSQFKNEIIQKQKDDEQETRNNVGNNPHANAFLRKREENYRKSLIDSKRNEPTKWEDFSDDTNSTNKYKGRINKTPRPEKLLDNIDLKPAGGFDAKTLTFQQNNHLKRFITLQTYKKKNKMDLKMAVEDLKRNGFAKPIKK